MNTPFKTILNIIDRVAANTALTNTLFQAATDVSVEDQHALETWSGKSIDQIKQILQPAYGKREIEFNPFNGTYDAMSAPLIFSRFDDILKPQILYSVEPTDYGQIIVASTAQGICYLVFFSGDESKVPGTLQKEFPGSPIIKARDEHQAAALDFLKGRATQPVHLHVKGTADQLQIWEALAQVPTGKLISYGTLAKATRHMAQEIGVAMGDNRLAMLIPCHRVIKATGELGQYHWGAKRKQAMIIKEAKV